MNYFITSSFSLARALMASSSVQAQIVQVSALMASSCVRTETVSAPSMFVTGSLIVKTEVMS